jgi:hypothetical protein
MTPEGKVKQKVKKYLTEMGCYYAMPATGGYGLSGTPDFLVCYRGRFVGIECKAGKNVPTALQLAALDRITGAGGLALVIDETNVDDLKELFGYE